MDVEMLWAVPIGGVAITLGYYAQRFVRDDQYVEDEDTPSNETAVDSPFYKEAPTVHTPQWTKERQNTIFLSYRRRPSWPLAQLIRNELTRLGFDVFLDISDINSGPFEPVILTQIEVRRHFLLLVDLNTFDGIQRPGDWLHREISHALEYQRNIVPLLLNGAHMPNPASLPADIAEFAKYNAVDVPSGYVPEAMERLRDRFLR